MPWWATSARESKYPYNPFYGSFSPARRRGLESALSQATASEAKFFGHEGHVIRGGYGRVYGRLNGVDLVLVPLLGVGLIQPVQCTQALARRTLRSRNDRPQRTPPSASAVDGNTRSACGSQPHPPPAVLPGVQQRRSSAADGLDPDFRPNVLRYVRSHHPAPDQPQ